MFSITPTTGPSVRATPFESTVAMRGPSGVDRGVSRRGSPREELADLLALCRIDGLSWFLIGREAVRHEGVSRLWASDVTERSKEAATARELLQRASRERSAHRVAAERILELARAAHLGLTTVLDEDYPLNLRTIFNAPPFLFYRGVLNADQDACSVAVVGTRQASPEGLRRSSKMAKRLAAEGITVLSGLARGIDTAAHRATLDAGGRTVAVLGSGLMQIYPPENASLAAQIAESGAVVSQFWPEAPPTKHSFPMRNITMSGMAQGTVVIEASSTSGAKMQARLALQHGKKVFLVTNLVTSQPWARSYLKRGALEVRDVEDIVKHLRTAEYVRARAKQAEQITLGLD